MDSALHRSRGAVARSSERLSEWHIAWHGDDPGAPPLDPIQDLFSFVTRADIAEDGSVCEPSDWLADNAITVDEALVMMTREAAYALHVDDRVGTLEVGKRADLIVFDADPRTVDPYAITGISLLATWSDGELMYCRDPGSCR